jgi:PIN domain nuclease of toxin-antitoxin system
MKLMLDTHTLLWFYSGDEKLSTNVKNIILDKTNQCYVSIASLWEITIKINLGKLIIEDSITDLFEFLARNNFEIVEITLADLLELNKLPKYHKDPFDRLIISQTISRRLEICSFDEEFELYSIKIIK